MTYRVRWAKTARRMLAEVWLAHPDRNAVTAASHRIDQILARAPDEQGESRPDQRRIMFDAPLVVIYRIDEANHRVTILQVRGY